MSQKTMAQKMLTSAETAGAANPSMLLNVGDLYAEGLNLDKESRRIYQMVIETFPDAPSAAEAQARLDR
jgi:TolA-binding protein